ncbi:cystine/glutamate transporter-like [Diadema antillarum]|uniref:cystine/glutamate transporter-like n=1 Tax=Diadema antillarum TaxID=105358 RepID=UPI003A8A4B46
MALRGTKKSQKSDSELYLNTKDDDPIRLSRQVTLLDSISLIVGGVIGSGIFISPTSVLANSGGIGWALLIWVFCGILSILGALTYAELGTTFSVSGGDFSYLLEACGPIPAFLRLWSSIVALRTAPVVVLSLTFASNLLLPLYVDCSNPEVTTRLTAALMMGVIFFLNSTSVPGSRFVNAFMTVAKLAALLVIIIAGIVQLAQGNVANFTGAFDTSDFSFRTFPLAVYSGLFAYSGWQYLPQVTEEIINPSRTIPLAVIISMTIVTVVYLLTNVAYFTVLSADQVLSSSSVALDFGRIVLGDWYWILGIGVALSCLGSSNGTVFSFSRVLLVASREGMMPSIASMIHVDRKTPLPAAAVMAPVCLVMLIGGNVNALINYLSVTRWLVIGATCAIVPYYRWKYPDLERPFKVPLVIPVVFFLCCMFIVAMSLYSSPVDCGIGLGIFFGGIPVYYIFVWWENKPIWFNQGMDHLTVFLQQLLCVVPPEDIQNKSEILEEPGRVEESE